MRPSSTLTALALSLVIAAPASVRTDMSLPLLTQDPPVIPRALIKRQGSGPQRFVRTELFFGTAANDDVVTEEEFSAFLDAEVSPRFPEGLTLFKGHGRFTGQNGVLVKEDPFVVILLHPHDQFKVNDRKIEAIRRAYRQQFQQESVLRVDYQFSVRVSF